MSHWRHRILNKLPNIMQILLLICSDTKGSILGTILYKHSWTENCSTIDNLSFRNVSEKTRKYQRMEKSRELLVEVEGHTSLMWKETEISQTNSFQMWNKERGRYFIHDKIGEGFSGSEKSNRGKKEDLRG